MRLKILEWNIHQQGRHCKDGKIPLWILDEIPNDINIVVFTEFNSHAQNILAFYDNLVKKGFSYSTTNYSYKHANDILIAVRGEGLEIEAISYVSAYRDVSNTNLSIDQDTIPENLRIDINVNGTHIHLWGIRIKDLHSDYQKKADEMETAMRWVNEVDGIRILIGDFNNLRENTPEQRWNLRVLDETIGDSFERKTPSENHSWGVSWSERHNLFDGYIKNDHLIHSKDIAAIVNTCYKWDFLSKCNYLLKEPSFRKRELVIPVGEPDHGILIGELVIGEEVKEAEEPYSVDENVNESEELEYFYDEILSNVDEDDQGEVFDKDD